MAKRWRHNILFITMLVLFIGTISRVDRVFFKRNSSFSIRFLYSCLEPNPEWDLPPLTLDQSRLLDQILEQKFQYLAKGVHCYAFVSQDQKYVIKFHRYPSHMRVFPWLTHPFSYYFSERRKKIKAYNLQRLRTNFDSYKNSYLDLQNETGILLTHINPTKNLQRSICLIDKTKAEYEVSLDDVTFVLQKKADLIYPILDKLTTEKKLDEAKQAVTHIVDLIASYCQKGYMDNDPILKRNYGLLEDQAILIDVGDIIKNEKIMERENYIPYIKKTTQSFRQQLQSNYPELLEHYDQIIDRF